MEAFSILLADPLEKGFIYHPDSRENLVSKTLPGVCILYDSHRV